MNKIHKGFSAEEDAIMFLKAYNMKDIECFKIVVFKGEYYIVGFSNYETEIVIGNSDIWLRNDGYMVRYETPKLENSNVISIEYDVLRVNMIDFKDGVYKDMLKEDRNVRVLHIKKDSESNYYTKRYTGNKNSYIVLLGLTFYDRFYKQKDLGKLKKYFKEVKPLRELMNKYPSVSEINPFKGVAKIEFRNGQCMYAPYRMDYSYDGYKKVYHGYKLQGGKIKPLIKNYKEGFLTQVSHRNPPGRLYENWEMCLKKSLSERDESLLSSRNLTKRVYKRLGISREVLYRCMDELGIEPIYVLETGKYRIYEYIKDEDICKVELFLRDKRS